MLLKTVAPRGREIGTWGGNVNNLEPIVFCLVNIAFIVLLHLKMILYVEVFTTKLKFTTK